MNADSIVHTKQSGNSTMPKVSIIIISYNQEKFIADAILGAVHQDYENLEVIVSDDASSDKTSQIIGDLALKYPRLIPLLNKQNGGITINCNRALRACSGELITMIGGDDVMLPGKVTAQVGWFKSDLSRVLCGHLVESICEDGSISLNQEITNPVSRGYGPLNFLHRSDLLHCTSIMVRKSAIPEHGFDEAVTVASDYLFWVEVLMSGGEYGCVDGVYAQRRGHAGSVTQNQSKIFEDVELSYRIIGERYPVYKKLSKKLIAEHVYYYQGGEFVKAGKKTKGRRYLLQSIALRPLYPKAWFRLFQSFI